MIIHISTHLYENQTLYFILSILTNKGFLSLISSCKDSRRLVSKYMTSEWASSRQENGSELYKVFIKGMVKIKVSSEAYNCQVNNFEKTQLSSMLPSKHALTLLIHFNTHLLILDYRMQCEKEL